VSILAPSNVELRQYMAHVSLDGALAQVEAFGNARIGQAFCHQLKDLAFPLGELFQRRAVGARWEAPTPRPALRPLRRLRGGILSKNWLTPGPRSRLPARL
jgi:hypothetical protein